jgi:two-component system sensor histidine kinase KdpD
LIELVDELLDTSRMDSGMLELEKNPTDISNLIKSAVKEASGRLDQYQIVTALPESLPPAKIDVVRINQVLNNLINNAAKNSPAGTEILITAKKKDRDIEIRIADNGPVIPINELENIFDRLYRTEQKVHTEADGMGLSLHICQRIVEAHDGIIWAESIMGEGNSIYFTLPL